MKLAVCAALVAMLFLAGCSVFTSESWRGDRQWRYEPPKTGSNVGRWIPVGEAAPSKRRTAKKVRAAKHEVPRDTTPAAPPDRFR